MKDPGGGHHDRIRQAIRTAVAFHILILVPSFVGFDGGDMTKIAAFAMIPFWSTVLLVVWKRGNAATRVDDALIKFLYPVLFGAFYLWNGLASS
jgi:hypothetical protein